ncbi:unnamed protein product [Arctia plantaginis]|uniref:Uncharacterized protein n=1 Tax=Arctia plantaginis TaxID=874455 RepID=A0A8S1B0R4_ARCPL|nr:unnamed protein product [Arctia plantaginis]
MVTEHLNFKETASKSSVQHNPEKASSSKQPTTSKMIDKSIQVYMTKSFRSKGNQTEIKFVNQMTSPLKPYLHSASTSPFKINLGVSCNPSRPNLSVLRRIRKEEQSDSDTSYTPSLTHPESSPSTKSLQMESASDCSELIEADRKQEALKMLQWLPNARLSPDLLGILALDQAGRRYSKSDVMNFRDGFHATRRTVVLYAAGAQFINSQNSEYYSQPLTTQWKEVNPLK